MTFEIFIILIKEIVYFKDGCKTDKGVEAGVLNKMFRDKILNSLCTFTKIFQTCMLATELEEEELMNIIFVSKSTNSF